MNKPKNAIDAIHEMNSLPHWKRPAIDWTPARQNFFYRKNLVELILGALMLVVLSPLILLLWVMVKLSSKGPGFYKQTRVGLNGVEFECFKLRSMRLNAEIDGQPIWCKKGDSRITWLGCILRMFHLDELPQLVNVVRGEMVLVGPRPERPMICEELNAQIDGYYDRVLVKPGITGLSQINLKPDQNLADVKRKQVLDLLYINQADCWLEFRVLLATGLRMIGIKGDTVMKWMYLCRHDVLSEMGLPVNDEAIGGSQSEESEAAEAWPLPRNSTHANSKEKRRVYSMASDSTSGREMEDDSYESSSVLGMPR